MDTTQYLHLTLQNDSLGIASQDHCKEDGQPRMKPFGDETMEEDKADLEDKADPDIDVLRLSPEPEEMQESAAERVRRELASNQAPDHKDTLHELSRLVGNIAEPASPAPLAKPIPLRPSAVPSPVQQPLPAHTPHTPSFQRQLRALAGHHEAMVSSPRRPHAQGLPPPVGHAGLMSPSMRWLPTWPSPPLHHPSVYRLPQFQGLSPWSCSSASAPVSPLIPPYSPFLPFAPIRTPNITTSTPSAGSDLSPLDLSGSSKAKSSPADSSSSDLASPLKDVSPPQPPSPKRARIEPIEGKKRSSEENPRNEIDNHASSVNNNIIGMNRLKEAPEKRFLPPSPYLGSLAPQPLNSPFRSPISMPYFQRSPPIPHRQDAEGGDPLGRRRRFLSPESVRILSDWYTEHEDHPYPSDQIVERLANRANISVFQVKKWMANKRVRSCNTLAFNGSIHPKKLQKLIQLKANSAVDSADEEAGGVPKETPKSARGSRFLDPSAVDHMNKWYNDHIAYPYPTEDEKNTIAKEAGLTVAQVTCWFANKRNRNNKTKKIHSKEMWQRVNRRVEFSESPPADRPLLGRYPVHPGFNPGHLMPTHDFHLASSMPDSN